MLSSTSIFSLPIFIAAIMSSTTASPLPTPPRESLRFYTSGYDGLIRHFDFLPSQPGTATATATQVGSINLTDAVGPSWLEYVYSPSGKLTKMYAVDEMDVGRVLAFDVDPSSGDLTLKQVASTGAGPVTVTTTGGSGQPSCLITADYTAGSVTIHALHPEDGGFVNTEPAQTFQFNGSGPVLSRQDHSYAHQAILDPSGRFVYVCDLGADQIHILAVPQPGNKTDNDASCAQFKLLTPSINLPPASGPRHLTFHTSPSRSTTTAYLVSELSNTITTFTQNPQTGTLQQIGEPILVLPPGTTFPGYAEDAPNVGEVAVSADGHFVLVSTRNAPNGGTEDHIAVFSRCERTGALSWVDWYPTGGKTVRHFSMSGDAGSRFVLAANQGSDSVMVFSRDPITGDLTKETLITGVGKPNFAKFV
ncbi:unnamed protein product [Tilletia caries]|uniref:6-phosphogluconolactonase n=2 Tax=Tilletia TaxID=13289 RepID=A0A177V8B9_9BASI|nr:hypothetical protein CF336_g1977 [Tilletia laevis]KAE8261060.1 hypothetical protein A4X03_0g3577 [Tilletia caries]KAE8200413.1 hypothetical protein CF335_g3963 [Tilletia laevis]CAD6891106.1 unnamed protein product [Tilletia caries]CAD6934133.1 unnamed protein product [Tilletia caries]